jgi:hypothetical protein
LNEPSLLATILAADLTTILETILAATLAAILVVDPAIAVLNGRGATLS